MTQCSRHDDMSSCPLHCNDLPSWHYIVHKMSYAVSLSVTCHRVYDDMSLQCSRHDDMSLFNTFLYVAQCSGHDDMSLFNTKFYATQRSGQGDMSLFNTIFYVTHCSRHDDMRT